MRIEIEMRKRHQKHMHAAERCCSDAIMDVISDESATVSQVSAAMRATCSGQDEAAPITAAGNRVPSFSVELLEVEPVNVKVLEMQPSSNNRALPVPTPKMHRAGPSDGGEQTRGSGWVVL